MRKTVLAALAAAAPPLAVLAQSPPPAPKVVDPAPAAKCPFAPAAKTGGKCPVTGAISAQDPAEKAEQREDQRKQGSVTTGPYTTREWWPNQLNLRVLHQNPAVGNPMGPDFNYAAE